MSRAALARAEPEALKDAPYAEILQESQESPSERKEEDRYSQHAPERGQATDDESLRVRRGEPREARKVESVTMAPVAVGLVREGTVVIVVVVVILVAQRSERHAGRKPSSGHRQGEEDRPGQL